MGGSRLTVRAIAALALAFAVAGVGAAPALAAESVRVLILSGANNHEWRATTPVLRRIFEANARFAVVDVVEDPSRCDAARFARSDVVASNWSAFPALTGRQWGPAAEKAFVDFVSGGKGFVAFHAASATSQDWPEFQQLVGLTWGMGTTGHSAYHTFTVTIEPADHPITHGLRDFWTTDELWHAMVPIAKPDHAVLATAWSSRDFGGTGKFEPVLLTTKLGAGRGVTIVLGHDVAAMENVGFQTLMLRATEWAATGETTGSVPADWPSTAAAAVARGVSIDAALDAVRGYRLGGNRRPLFVVEQLVDSAASRTDEAGRAERRRLASAIAAALATDVHADVKNFLCRQLAAIGTPDEVPALAACLREDALADLSRAALERIGGPAAAKALLDELASATGSRKIGIVNSLGNRRDAEAVPSLAALLGSPDRDEVEAAAAALAKVGDAAAVAALTRAWAAAGGSSAAAILAPHCLACADRLLGEGTKDAARSIYREAYQPAQPMPVRMAALRGLVACETEDADRLLAEAIACGDRRLGSAAVQIFAERARESGEAGAADRVVEWFEAALARSTRVEERRALLRLAARQSTARALRLALAHFKDPSLVEEASAAAIEAASALVEEHRAEVKEAARAVLAVSTSPETRARAEALLMRAARSANLARAATATSPDGLEPDGGSGPDAAAIDGNADTYWDETDNQKLYRFLLTFPQPTEVSAINLKGHAYQSHSPKDFEIVCDGAVVAKVENAAYDWSTNEVFVAFARTRLTTLELRITGSYGGSPGIRELEVYAIDER